MNKSPSYPKEIPFPMALYKNQKYYSINKKRMTAYPNKGTHFPMQEHMFEYAVAADILEVNV